MRLYSSPFSRGFWKTAAAELKDLRALVFCALMVGASVALGLISIPVSVNLRVSVSFLARALAAAVGGPVLGVLYGITEDILGWVIRGDGPFFLGYTLDTVLAVLVYALFFYRQRITIWRVVAAKFLTTFPISVGLGCLWSKMLYGKGYLYYAAKSLVKNAVYFPIQTVLLLVVFRALLPMLKKLGFIAPSTEIFPRFVHK